MPLRHFQLKNCYRDCLKAAVFVAIFPAINSTIVDNSHAAENKIQFSDKTSATPRLRVGNTPDPRLSPSDLESKGRPGVIIDANITTPQQPPSASRQRSLELYIDKKQNWMFADPKEQRGQTTARDALGVDNALQTDAKDKKSIEKYWERNSQRNSNTNATPDSKTSGRADEELDRSKRGNQTGDNPNPFASAAQMGLAGNDNPFRGLAAANPLFNERLGSPTPLGVGFGAGIQLPAANAGLPTIEPSLKPLEAIRSAPLASPLESFGIRLDAAPGMREGGASPSRPAPVASSGPARMPAADLPQVPSLQRPDIRSPGLLGGPRGFEPGGMFAPSFATPASSQSSPQRPPTLEFPKRGF